jgi:hypothetical protein
MWLATLGTRHFDFEAAALTEAGARDALAAGLAHHAAQHDLDPEWVTDMLEDASIRALTLDACYRDHNQITGT